MAKYQRRGSGSWTISSTLLGWGVTGLAVLLVGFFLAGLYIGYGMGIEEGKAQLSDELRASGEDGEISDQIAQLIDNQRANNGGESSEGNMTSGSTNRSDVGTDTSGQNSGGAFTEEDLGFLGEGSGTEEQQAASAEMADQPPEEETSQSSSSEEGSASNLYPGADETSSDESESTSEPSARDSESSPYDFDRSSDTDELESFFTIQTVSFKRQDYAKEAAEELRTEGHSVMVNETLVNGTTYYRVRVGVFPTRSQASDYADEMKDRGEVEDYWISEVTRE